MYRLIDGFDHILSKNSKGLSDESIKLLVTADNSLAPSLNYFGIKLF